MNELTIIKRDGGAYIDSREVAELIGKRHDHLLRDIRNYAEIIRKNSLPNFGERDFFVENSYKNSRNQEMPHYLISKLGAEVCAHKLTGEKGVLFTAAYVKRFNEMEAAEREAEIKALAKPRLSEFNGAVRNVLSGMSYCRTKPKSVMDFLKNVYEPLGVEVNPFYEGDCLDYFTATEIAEMLGVYSETGRPHGRAVAAIISKLNIRRNQIIAIPYGLVGVSCRYDSDVVCEVMEWLISNSYPSKVPYLDFFYHTYYDQQQSLFDCEIIVEL